MVARWYGDDGDVLFPHSVLPCPNFLIWESWSFRMSCLSCSFLSFFVILVYSVSIESGKKGSRNYGCTRTTDSCGLCSPQNGDPCCSPVNPPVLPPRIQYERHPIHADLFCRNLDPQHKENCMTNNAFPSHSILALGQRTQRSRRWTSTPSPWSTAHRPTARSARLVRGAWRRRRRSP